MPEKKEPRRTPGSSSLPPPSRLPDALHPSFHLLPNPPQTQLPGSPQPRQHPGKIRGFVAHTFLFPRVRVPSSSPLHPQTLSWPYSFWYPLTQRETWPGQRWVDREEGDKEGLPGDHASPAKGADQREKRWLKKHSINQQAPGEAKVPPPPHCSSTQSLY